jgi:hypothetical protein
MPGGNDIVVTVSGESSPGVNVASDGDLIGVAVTSVGDRGPKGDTGPANTLAIGTVATGAAGSNASATLTGAAPDQTLSLVLPRGDAGSTGATGAAGASVELQTTATHVQWRLVGGSTWTNLIALSAITGPQGSTGAAGTNGTNGSNIELQTTSTHVQWRLVGGSTWTDLVALSAITGPQGSTGSSGATGAAGPANSLAIGTVTGGATASATITGSAPSQTLNLVLPQGDKGTDGADVEFQSSATHLQWRFVGGSTWNNLVALTAITGPQGSTGATGATGANIELQASATHLQWRLVGGSTWTDLVTLTSITGAQGATGPANSLSIGTVTSGATASATITGSAPNQTLSLVLPKGDTGSTGNTGSTGAAGPANTLSIGTVTGGASASATITGAAPNQTLSLVLPKGDTGSTGNTAAVVYTIRNSDLSDGTFEIKTTADSSYSSVSTLRLIRGQTYQFIGDSSTGNYVRVITTRFGSTAAVGATNATSSGGTTTYTVPFSATSSGVWLAVFAGGFSESFATTIADTGGAAASVTVGTTTTGAAGSSAAVTNSGDSSAAVLNFTIPAGAAGQNGAAVELQATATHIQWRYVGASTWTNLVALSAITGPTGPQGPATIAIGTVTTGAAGSSATVTNSGDSSNVVLDFSLPRGSTGAAGSGGASLGLVLALS